MTQAKSVSEAVVDVDAKTIDKGEKILQLYEKGQELNEKRLLK